ncbi:MAG: hypothetical protein ACI8QC_002581 [Planctomycetota bacterium]|jgi:hypothetical protein
MLTAHLRAPRTFAQVLLLALLLAPAASSQAPAPLERALAAIKPASAKADLYFLADDAMGGRDTPSQGLEIAGQYLVSRVSRLGFTPLGRDGWFWEYPLSQRKLDASRTLLEATGPQGTIVGRIGHEIFPERSSHLTAWEASGGVVFIGDGDKQILEDTDVSGYWVWMADPSKSLRRVARRAEEAGAQGLLVSPAEDYSGKPYSQRFGSLAERFFKGYVGQSKFDPETGRAIQPAPKPAAEQAFPVVMATPDFTRALLAGAGLSDWPKVGKSVDLQLHDRRAMVAPAISARNVCALWPGSDPLLKNEVIVVSAHYDHVGEREDGTIFNGADDNGSGTTGVLQLAEALAAHGPLQRSVLLMWVSGEEKGLWGSEAWTRDPHLLEGQRVIANINIDMIGRTQPGELYITPTREHRAFNAVAAAAYGAAQLEGFPELLSQDADWARSDHKNFDQHLKVPVAFLSAGDHPDYHKPTDTPDKIDFDKLCRVARTVTRMLVDLAEADVNATPPELSDADKANALASRIQKDFDMGSVAVLEKVFDEAAFTKLCGEPFQGAPKAQLAYARQVAEERSPIATLQGTLQEAQNQVLGLVSIDERQAILVRSNYLDTYIIGYYWLYLGFERSGSASLIDVRSLQAGESDAEAIQRHTRLIFHKSASSPNLGLERYLANIQTQLEEQAGGIEALVEALPDYAQRDHGVLRMLTAATLDQAEPEDEGFRKWFDQLGHSTGQKDSQAYLAVTQIPFQDNQAGFDEAVAYLAERIPDEHLADFVRADYDLIQSDYQTALGRIRSLLETHPELEFLHWMSLEATQGLERYDMWAPILKTLTSDFGLTLERVRSEDFFDFFRQSPEYANWAENH